MKTNGLNSIFEILSIAGLMSQNDPLFTDEYRNPLIECARVSLFSPATDNNAETIYLNLLHFWMFYVNEPRNSAFTHLIFLHALNTIKTIYLSSSSFLLLLLKFKSKH